MALSDALAFLTKQSGDTATRWLTAERHRQSMAQAYTDLSVAAPSVTGNLLTSNVATGTGTLGTTSGFLASSATVASSTDYAWEGSKSLKVTVTSTSNRASVGGTTSAGTIAVSAGQTYTFAAYVLAPTVTKVVAARIYWFTSAGAALGSTNSTDYTTSTSWQRASITAVAPATAAFASVMLFGTGAAWASGDVRYEDGYTFHVGAGGLWVPPGVPVPNLGSRANPADATQVQIWNPGNSTWITV